jgi:holo-[acyl-carrier protein] synthase
VGDNGPVSDSPDLALDSLASDLVASVGSGRIVAIGTDLVELDRFRVTLERTPTIVDRLYTVDERAYARKRNDPTERFAVRFAAKEAAMKAMGVGLGEVAFREIEVVRAKSGEPSLLLNGSAAQRAEELGIERLLITMTHSDVSAVAFVVALGSDPGAESA